MRSLGYLAAAFCAGGLYGALTAIVPLILVNVAMAAVLAVVVAVFVARGAAGSLEGLAPLFALAASATALYAAWAFWWWLRIDAGAFLLMEPAQLWRSVSEYANEATVAVSRRGTTAEMGTGWFYFTWSAEALGVVLLPLAAGLLMRAARGGRQGTATEATA